VMVLKTTANNALIMYSGVIKNSVPLWVKFLVRCGHSTHMTSQRLPGNMIVAIITLSRERGMESLHASKKGCAKRAYGPFINILIAYET
jgi:hypothetical protein